MEPPFITFSDLQNVVNESDQYALQPCLPPPSPALANSVTSTAYFLGPAQDWLQWDSSRECFCGTVSTTLASNSGSQRLDTYTILLELVAAMVVELPAGIRLEQVVRCALPLTVRRRPDSCAAFDEVPRGPSVYRPTASLRNLPCMRPPQQLGVVFEKSNGIGDSKDAEDTPLLCSQDPKEVYRLLRRKEDAGFGERPLKLNALSLARIHEAYDNSAGRAEEPITVRKAAGELGPSFPSFLGSV